MLKYTFSDATVQVFQDNTNKQGIEMQDGFLIIEVLKADRTPLPRVSILIYTEDQGRIITKKVTQTGIDGRTERIQLLAPVKKYTQTETTLEVPYSTFTILLALQGYYTNIYRNTQIFPDTLTQQTFKMDPLPFGMENA